MKAWNQLRPVRSATVLVEALKIHTYLRWGLTFQVVLYVMDRASIAHAALKDPEGEQMQPYFERRWQEQDSDCM